MLDCDPGKSLACRVVDIFGEGQRLGCDLGESAVSMVAGCLGDDQTMV